MAKGRLAEGKGLESNTLRSQVIDIVNIQFSPNSNPARASKWHQERKHPMERQFDFFRELESRKPGTSKFRTGTYGEMGAIQSLGKVIGFSLFDTPEQLQFNRSFSGYTLSIL